LRFLMAGGNGFMGTLLAERLLEGTHFMSVYPYGPNRFRATPTRAKYVEGRPGNYGLLQKVVEGSEVV
jgi:nucleoside-diphosphate-sugar epimerase